MTGIKRKSPVRRELWRDLLGCWLLSFAGIATVDILFSFHLPLLTLCLHALVLTALLLLVGRRLWIWPLILTVGALVTLLVLYINGSLFAAWTDAVGFIKWWAHFCPENSPYYTDGYICLLQWIAHTGICALTCLLVRGARQTWLAGVLLTAFIAVAIASEPDTSLTPWAPAALILGWLLLLPLPLPTTWEKVTAALLAAVVCATVFLPVSWESLTSQTPLKLFSQDSQEEEEQDVSSDLHTIGLQEESGRLGGPISQGGSRVVMRIRGEDAALMRVGVYAEYEGDRWSKSTAGWMPMDEGHREYLAGTGVQGGQKVRLEITLEQNCKLLPTTGAVCRIDADTEKTGSLRFTVEQVFSVRKAAKQTYLLETCLRDQDGNLYPAYDYQVTLPYLQLPDTLPEIVSDTAQRVTEGITDNEERVYALCEYLQKECTYTLTPSALPAGEDFVGYFLETKEGYCTYYASALAVMARTLQIPSRFVYGYGLERDGDEFVARECNAHAWVECFIAGKGWITVDPTVGAGYVDGIAEDTTTVTSTTVSPATTVSRPTASTSASSVTTTVAADDAPHTESVLPIVAGVVLLLLCVGAVIAWRVLRFTRGWQLCFVQRRYPDTASQLRWYMRDLYRQAKLLGVPLRSGETLTSWKRRAKSLSAAFPEAVTTEEAYQYGGKHPTTEQIARLAALREELEQLLKTRLSPLRYLWHRFFRL